MSHLFHSTESNSLGEWAEGKHFHLVGRAIEENHQGPKKLGRLNAAINRRKSVALSRCSPTIRLLTDQMESGNQSDVLVKWRQMQLVHEHKVRRAF